MSRRLALLLVCLVLGRAAEAQRPLADYRYFRALSIDLNGRPPTRAELADLERPDFDIAAWIDNHLSGRGYVERVTRIYTDLLRLELPDSSISFAPRSILLRWTSILGPDGRPIDLYFRNGQRRAQPAIDGQVCFTAAEIGIQVPSDGASIGTPKAVTRKLLEARTVVVRPWWLYADYARPLPRDRASAAWVQRFGYELVWSMFTEPDGRTPMTGVRVCREEAQTAETGRVFATGYVAKKADPLLPGRLTRLPSDTPFAVANAGSSVSCSLAVAFESSHECGCGPGLERCLPSGPNGFVSPWHAPLGKDATFFAAARPAILWLRAWWSEEATKFIEQTFAGDQDVRLLLTSPATRVNGPLAQFYRFFANTTCCGAGTELGYTRPVPLFDPAAVPTTLAPFEVSTWATVENRGEHAAGILTMPIFLLKYGSQRQRAHAIYKAFMCREFVAETVKLEPSTEPDLTKRTGCATCHRRLEPMAAYFARVVESGWTYLPPTTFPLSSPRCTARDRAQMSPACATFYDPDFTDERSTMLRGAYGAPAHADAGPRGFAAEVSSSPDFAPCVVRNVAQSFLGRPLTSDDERWRQELSRAFVTGGYRIRALVQAIVTSRQYREANDVMTEAR